MYLLLTVIVVSGLSGFMGSVLHQSCQRKRDKARWEEIKHSTKNN